MFCHGMSLLLLVNIWSIPGIKDDKRCQEPGQCDPRSLVSGFATTEAQSGSPPGNGLLLPKLCVGSRSQAATEALARQLARLVSHGDTFLLSGSIGSGKTVFARAFIKTLLAAAGLDEDVPSPTYTLVQTYSAGPLEIWHVDLFRLDTAADAAELALDDAFSSAVCLIEWPDRLGWMMPANPTRIHFEQAADAVHSRILHVSPVSERMLKVLREAGATAC